jgi:diguanylate cyclase (GGDEF)-like protein
MNLRRPRSHAAAVAGSAPGPQASARLDEVGAIDVERALRLVRIAIALLASAAVIGARDTIQGGLTGPAAVAAIIAGVAVTNGYTAWTGRRGYQTAQALGGEVLDVAGGLGLVLLLDRPLDGSSWMVMLLPIVMGGVRLGAGGTLLGWTLGCAGYLAIAVSGVVKVSEVPSDAFATALQRFAFLLAIAVPVAALTQWLQHRWEHQRTVAVAAEARARRLELIESMARSFVGSTEPRLLANLADAGLRLGFSTVTITMEVGDRSTTIATVGETRWLPTDDVLVRPAPNETLVTHWEGRDDVDQLTSTSISLDTTGRALAVHGWSEAAVPDDLATGFGLLGAHASVALQAARALADVERQANLDGLTGLLNRRAFDAHLERLATSGQPVAMLLLDVDHFKAINDGYGHLAGDQVLRVIAERLSASIRYPADPLSAVVARLGGDEFAVVIAGAPLERVADVADRIERSMAHPVAIDGASIPVTFSIGIADTDGAWTTRSLISAADGAAYRAKEHGRNRTSWASEPVSDGAARTTTASPAAALVDDPLMSLLERSIGSSDLHGRPLATQPHPPIPPRSTP